MPHIQSRKYTLCLIMKTIRFQHMKHLIPAILAGCCLPLSGGASPFAQNLERLAVENPEFVSYADFRGDFASAGAFLTDAYLAYMMTRPDLPPVPVDFTRLFGHLGLASMETVTAVSEPRPGGGFTNQMLVEFSGPPSGLFVLFGDSNQPFAIKQTAPADADLVAEMNLNGVALFAIIRGIATDIMGPMGQGLIDNQMNQPVVPDGPTLAELITRLTTRIQIAVKPDFGSDLPNPPAVAFMLGKAAFRIANVADLLDSFSPILQQAGFARMDGADGTVWTFTVPNETYPATIHLTGIRGSNDLLIAFNEGSKDWFLDSGDAIASSGSFIEETTGLPEAGLSFWYTSAAMAELQIQQLDAQTSGNEQYLPLISALKSFLLNYTGAQAGVSLIEDNAYRAISYQPTSYKTSIALAGAIVPISFATAYAATLQQQAEAAAAEADPTATEAPASPSE